MRRAKARGQHVMFRRQSGLGAQASGPVVRNKILTTPGGRCEYSQHFSTRRRDIGKFHIGGTGI